MRDMNRNRRKLLALGAAAPLAEAVYSNETNETLQPRAWQGMPAREAIRKRYFPDLVLRTHEGKAVRLYEDLIKDKVVTLNFMYANCADGTCPITTHNLVQVQRLLKDRVGKDLFMYSITLDPERDTPAELSKYARAHHVGPGWLFLRAEPNDTEVLRRKLGFYDRDRTLDADKANHIGMIRYGNEPRQLWSACSSMAEPYVIARAIRWVERLDTRRAGSSGSVA